MAKAKKKAVKKPARKAARGRKDLTRIDPGPRMSDAIIHEGRVFLAGQVAERSKGRSVREQTAEVLADIDTVLIHRDQRQNGIANLRQEISMKITDQLQACECADDKGQRPS